MDTLNKKIEYKIKILQKIDNKYKEELNNIYNEYVVIYTRCLLSLSLEELNLELLSNNILERLDNLSLHLGEKEYLKEYKDLKINLDITQLDIKLCSNCQIEMYLCYDTNTYECIECGINDTLENTYDKILPRSKIGNFNPERHFKTWIDRILAKESTDEIASEEDPNGDKTIEQIKDSLMRKCKSKLHLTIDDIRVILKELGKTQLNKNTSLIAKRITGRSPPNLDENKYNKVYSLFLKVMDARDKLSINYRCNRIYYPYYIQKLLNIFLETPEERKMLNYIHLN